MILVRAEQQQGVTSLPPPFSPRSRSSTLQPTPSAFKVWRYADAPPLMLHPVAVRHVQESSSDFTLQVSLILTTQSFNSSVDMFLIKVRLGTEVLRSPSSTWPGRARNTH